MPKTTASYPRSWRCVVISILLVSSIRLREETAAFQPISVPKTRTGSDQRTLLSHYRTRTARNPQSISQLQSGSSLDEAVLTFRASLSYTTKPAPLPTNKKSLVDFFSSEQHRNSLLVGSGNIKAEPWKAQRSVLPELLLKHRWVEEAQLFGLEKPVNSDKLIRLKLKTSFLVFTIYAIAVLGVKHLLPQKSDGDEKTSPEYQFTLLGEEFHADGPLPLVWIFNQITAADKPKKATEDHTIHGMFRVWAKPGAKDLVFKCKEDVEVNIKFPALLLQLIPVEKVIIEEEASKELQKSLERDLPPGLMKFRDSYVQWLRS